ncbi:MAG TPA: mechanosensitive ion channel domain-containing protein [Thermomicrobiales bacterium]|nr:mechanosensitive ion channel domain-containing protein [Thermomicrobiales bacterium]
MNMLTVTAKLHDAFEQAVDQLISIGIGILSIAVVLLLARIIIRFARHIFWRRFGSRQLKADAVTLIDNGISFLVYFAATTLLLALGGASWSTLLTAISISTLAAVLGLQDLLKSVLGGIFVVLDQPYSVGDRVLLNGAEGEVMTVQLRTTIVRASDGHQVSIPNTAVLTAPLHNFDRTMESETIVRVSGICGNREETQSRLEALLSRQPPIDAKVIVTTKSPQRARTLITRWRGAPPDRHTNESLEQSDLQITILLADISNSAGAESDAVARLHGEFPGAVVSVKHDSAH